MRCLFLDDLQDSWRAEVELVEQEIIRVNRLQTENAKRLGREVVQVEGHNSLSTCPDGGGCYMAIIIIRKEDTGFQLFPSCDQRVVKGVTHIDKALLHVNAGVNLFDGFLRFR